MAVRLRPQDHLHNICIRGPIYSRGLDGTWWMIALDLFVAANIFPGGGSPVADIFAVALALALFALLYWAIELIDRI